MAASESSYQANTVESVEHIRDDKLDGGLRPEFEPQFMNAAKSVTTVPTDPSFGDCAPRTIIVGDVSVQSISDPKGINWDKYETLDEFLKA